MKLYRYFTKEEIEKYGIEDGKIYDEKSRIQSFAYINEDDVLPDPFILDSFKIYEVDLFGEKYFPDEYRSEIYANKLQILNEVNYEKFCNKIFNECTQEQLQVIKLKTDEILNKAITSEYNNCRAAVAIVGRDCDLDKLIYDDSVFVRREVSKHGRKKDLEILKNDVDTSLKTEVLMMLSE